MKEDKVSGVYKITNKVTGEFYIGCSKDIKQQWYQYRRPSILEQHPNVKLYQAIAQYGRDNFIIEVIEETDSLRERAQYWIDKLKPSYNSKKANGWDTENYIQNRKEYYKAHHDEALARSKALQNRLCLYEGKTFTLNNLSSRFRYYGIKHPYTEAKKYLI